MKPTISAPQDSEPVVLVEPGEPVDPFAPTGSEILMILGGMGSMMATSFGEKFLLTRGWFRH
jgi:hypothetical protein